MNKKNILLFNDAFDVHVIDKRVIKIKSYSHDADDGTPAAVAQRTLFPHRSRAMNMTDGCTR